MSPFANMENTGENLGIVPHRELIVKNGHVLENVVLKWVSAD